MALGDKLPVVMESELKKEMARKMDKPQELPNGISLNTVRTPGEYSKGSGGESVTDMPYTVGGFSLKVELNRAYDNGVKQTWSSSNSNDTWTRVLDNETWSPWLRLANTDDLARKADKTGTIYYIGGTVATPETTGFSTLGAYLRDMYHKGYRGVCGPIGDFDELDIKQWGYGMLATPGERGYVWNVEIFRSLTSTRQYRQLNADTGNWIMDDWEEYATKTDLLNKANVIITETNEPLDKMREFGWYLIQTPPSGYPPGYTTDSFFALFVSGRDIGWSPWLLMDLRTGATFRGGYSVGQFMPWVPIATATPPTEHDLPLAEGKVGADYNTFRKEQNGRVTLCVSIRRTDGSDLTGFEGAFTLPGGYCPYREEVRRIDLSGADGNPAGYAHLHIYPDGNAGIAGFGTGAKTAFCECGFWTA